MPVWIHMYIVIHINLKQFPFKNSDGPTGEGTEPISPTYCKQHTVLHGQKNCMVCKRVCWTKKWKNNKHAFYFGCKLMHSGKFQHVSATDTSCTSFTGTSNGALISPLQRNIEQFLQFRSIFVEVRGKGLP